MIDGQIEGLQEALIGSWTLLQTRGKKHKKELKQKHLSLSINGNDVSSEDYRTGLEKPTNKIVTPPQNNLDLDLLSVKPVQSLKFTTHVVIRLPGNICMLLTYLLIGFCIYFEVLPA